MKIAAAKSLVLLYDSLQLAHKCILNSFYGYVMRKGARWRSMEMAGVTTHLGGTIITVRFSSLSPPGRAQARGARRPAAGAGHRRHLVHSPRQLPADLQVGDARRPLLPDGVSLRHAQLPGAQAAHQLPVGADSPLHRRYQTEVDPKRHIFNTRSENSIFFELDGPYRAMVLPASTEEGRLLKKRLVYALKLTPATPCSTWMAPWPS